MAHYLTAFNGVTFSLLEPITQIPTATPLPGAVQVLGGGYDAFGSATAPAVFPYQVQFRALVTGASASAYAAAVNALRALGRTKGTLTRKDQNAVTTTCTARCLEVSAQDTVTTFAAIEVSLTFEIWSHWAKNATSGTTSLINPTQAVTVVNGGNVTVQDAILTFTAGTHAITALTVLCGSAKWAFSASITAGTALVVDCGAWSVKNNGVDAYQYFAFDAVHAIAGMLDIIPGTSYITVTATCAGTRSITVAFSEAWA